MDTIQSYPYDAVLGDIGIINDWIVTPNGIAPLQGAQWVVADRTWTYTYLPTSNAILGLLLLCIPFIGWILAIPVMASQTRAVTGYIEVTVLTRGLFHGRSMVAVFTAGASDRDALVAHLISDGLSIAALRPACIPYSGSPG